MTPDPDPEPDNDEDDPNPDEGDENDDDNKDDDEEEEEESAQEGLVKLNDSEMSRSEAEELILNMMKDGESFKLNGSKIFYDKAELMKKLKIKDEDEDEEDDDDKKKKTAKDTKKKEKDEPAGDEKATIALNDKIKVTEKDFIKLSNKIKKDSGDEEFEEIKKNEKLFNSLLVRYYNLTSSERAANEKHQDNAETKKQMEAAMEDIKAENDRIKAENDNIIKKEKDYEAEIKELKALLAKDPDDEVDDDKRTDLRLDQRDAKKRLDIIEKTEKPALEKSKEALEEERYVNYYEFCKTTLLANCPEFALSNPGLSYELINSQLEQDKFKGDEDDAFKTELFTRLFTDYMSKSVEFRKNNLIHKFYERNKRLYPGLEASAPVRNEKKDKSEEKKNKSKGKGSLGDIYDKIAKNGKEHPMPHGHQTGTQGKSSNPKETAEVKKFKTNAAKKFLLKTGI